MQPLTRFLRMGTALLAAAGLSMASACGGASNAQNAQNSASAQGTQPLSFMLDWTPNTNHIGLYVAQQLGYYKDAGINLTILPTAQAGAETSVENGVANVGFTTVSNVAAVNAQGGKLKFVFDLTQKPIARWCALASRADIHTPKDFSGKTFVSFGSAEQNSVIAQMSKFAGGSGQFKTAAVGTNTFDTLASGKGDFAGFYETWEGVQSRLQGPALHCFIASDWGVPGNPDQLGFAVSEAWLKQDGHRQLLTKFIEATKRGYDYALKNPGKAADMLVSEAKDAQIDPKLAKASMQDILTHGYWSTTDHTAVPGTVDMSAGQAYIDFQYKAGTYKNQDGQDPKEAPQVSKLATNEFVK